MIFIRDQPHEKKEKETGLGRGKGWTSRKDWQSSCQTSEGIWSKICFSQWLTLGCNDWTFMSTPHWKWVSPKKAMTSGKEALCSWGWSWSIWWLGAVYWLYLLHLCYAGSTSLKGNPVVYLVFTTDFSKDTATVSLKTETQGPFIQYILLLSKIYLPNIFLNLVLRVHDGHTLYNVIMQWWPQVPLKDVV